MGNCQKCIEAEKSIDAEIVTNQRYPNQLPLINMVDSFKNIKTDPNIQNKTKKVRKARISQSYFQKPPKQRKSANIEADKEFELIINNKINQNLNIDKNISENNNEKIISNSSDVEITNHNPILTESQEMDEEEEDYDEFVRKKQADELFDSEKNESEKDVIKNIEHSNDYYNDYNDGDVEFININQNYLEDVKDIGFEKEMNELNNMNYANIGNNNYYHYDYNEDYRNLNFNYNNKKIFTNNSCTFIHSKIIEEKEENEEDQESKNGNENSNKNNAKIANSNPDFKIKSKEKLNERKNSGKISENEEAVSYEADRFQNEVSYEMEGGEIENGNMECKLNLENGKYISYIGINKSNDANGGDDSSKYNTKWSMVKIIKQKLNDNINKIKNYPKGKFIITENFCDYIPDV